MWGVMRLLDIAGDVTVNHESAQASVEKAWAIPCLLTAICTQKTRGPFLEAPGNYRAVKLFCFPFQTREN